MTKSKSFAPPVALDPPAHPSLTQLATNLLLLLVAITVNLPLFPPFLLGTFLWGRPPTTPRLAQIARYLRLIFSIRPPPPRLTLRTRIFVAVSILTKAAMIPFWGLSWYLDELLYGRLLDDDDCSRLALKSPLFVISASRSGSTQLSRYIESDPSVDAPSILHCFFPYLWLWRLVPATIGRFVTPDYVRAKISSMFSEEALERHEIDPVGSDTFDLAFFSCHMNPIASRLGPDVFAKEMNLGRGNHVEARYMKDDFVRLVDRIGRKRFLLHEWDQQNINGGGGGMVPPRRRFYLKGHFLFAADALERSYPDASFVTVVRDPPSRLRSSINFFRVVSQHQMLGPLPWSWLAASMEHFEEDYCNEEMEFYSRTRRQGVINGAGGGDAEGEATVTAAKCVVRFDDFVSDLEGSMRRVYRQCGLGPEREMGDGNKDCDRGDGDNDGSDSNGGPADREDILPPHVPRTHVSRRRSGYAVDKSLEELGIDEEAFRMRLADYIAWCASQGSKKE